MKPTPSLVPRLLRTIAGFCLLATQVGCGDECEHSGRSWCEGNVRVLCSTVGGGGHARKLNYLERTDCEERVCMESEGHSACGISNATCGEQVGEICVGSVKASCRGGFERPVAMFDCADRNLQCVAVDALTHCSVSAETCDANVDRPHCVGEQLRICHGGYWYAEKCRGPCASPGEEACLDNQPLVCRQGFWRSSISWCNPDSGCSCVLTPEQSATCSCS